MEFLDFYTQLNGGDLSYKENNLAHKLYSTDKQNHHDYIVSYYDNEFSNKRDQNLNILEIGVLTGTSIRVWRKWFVNSQIFGLDLWVEGPKLVEEGLENINLTTADAYCEQTVESFEDDFFDYIIDDGPHTLDSQIYCVENWTKKLKSGGKLIVEDIKNMVHCEEIVKKVNQLGNIYNHTVHDFRNHKNRFLADDILLEIVKK